MINLLLLEPYHIPTILPIEVTILRGPRRMRIGASLRKRYGDFVPKLWFILAKLGYKKFLQRIYISIDVPHSVTSDLYQFPIVISVLQALGLFPTEQQIICLGKIDAHFRVIQTPLSLKVSKMCPEIHTPSNIELLQAINQLSQLQPKEAKILQPTVKPFWHNSALLSAVFPDVIWKNGTIDTDSTPKTILNKIPDEDLHLLIKSKYPKS